MADGHAAVRGRRAACVIGGALVAGTLGGEVRASDVAKPAAPSGRPAATGTPAAASAADLELLEFLGSDDVEPELQQYLANRAPARDGRDKR